MISSILGITKNPSLPLQEIDKTTFNYKHPFLPKDVTELICQHLTPPDLGRLALTCKVWRKGAGYEMFKYKKSFVIFNYFLLHQLNGNIIHVPRELLSAAAYLYKELETKNNSTLLSGQKSTLLQKLNPFSGSYSDWTVRTCGSVKKNRYAAGKIIFASYPVNLRSKFTDYALLLSRRVIPNYVFLCIADVNRAILHSKEAPLTRVVLTRATTHSLKAIQHISNLFLQPGYNLQFTSDSYKFNSDENFNIDNILNCKLITHNVVGAVTFNLFGLQDKDIPNVLRLILNARICKIFYENRLTNRGLKVLAKGLNDTNVDLHLYYNNHKEIKYGIEELTYIRPHNLYLNGVKFELPPKFDNDYFGT